MALTNKNSLTKYKKNPFLFNNVRCKYHVKDFLLQQVILPRNLASKFRDFLYLRTERLFFFVNTEKGLLSRLIYVAIC